MKIIIEVSNTHTVERKASVKISSKELVNVHLHLAFPEKRNRTGLYLRRHPFSKENDNQVLKSVGPNDPTRLQKDPYKIPISEHIAQMRNAGIIPSSLIPSKNGSDIFGSVPSMIAVPISDLVANLLRPSFHRLGLGKYKLFYFDEEPIDVMTYWCVCFFDKELEPHGLEFRKVRFDSAKDRAFDKDSGADLLESGLMWTAALVPLIINGQPLSAVEIAQYNYDLRQILGRGSEELIKDVYKAWFNKKTWKTTWTSEVEKIVLKHEKKGQPFGIFYHSILGIDQEKNIHIRQLEGTLPGLAKELANEGFVAAGVLDSGGSCAIYDVWMASYLNHNWYFREPRGSILVFELKSTERIPLAKDSWIQNRGEWKPTIKSRF